MMSLQWGVLSPTVLSQSDPDQNQSNPNAKRNVFGVTSMSYKDGDPRADIAIMLDNKTCISYAYVISFVSHVGKSENVPEFSTLSTTTITALTFWLICIQLEHQRIAINGSLILLEVLMFDQSWTGPVESSRSLLSSHSFFTEEFAELWLFWLSLTLLTFALLRRWWEDLTVFKDGDINHLGHCSVSVFASLFGLWTQKNVANRNRPLNWGDKTVLWTGWTRELLTNMGDYLNTSESHFTLVASG